MQNNIENYSYNIEDVCGYTVHSFYIEGPDRRKKSLIAKKGRTCLRIFVFAALAPFALIADTLVAIFN